MKDEDTMDDWSCKTRISAQITIESNEERARESEQESKKMKEKRI